jgi:hypothetical protein
LFARDRVARYDFIGCGTVGIEATEIRNDSPDGVCRQRWKRRHLRARNPGPYGLEEVAVFATMSEVSRRQSGTTISACLSSVTGLAGLRIQIPAGGNCGRITGEWILYRIGRIRALRDQYSGTQTYRRNPKITTSSPDRMQPAPSFMDHLLWSSLLVCPDFL